jgi:hypothetical protein
MYFSMKDFRQREADFLKRKTAQDMRRLFYFSHSEVNEPPNLIILQNRYVQSLTKTCFFFQICYRIFLSFRTTNHLDYLLDIEMKSHSSKSRNIAAKELGKIFLKYYEFSFK